jgi:hypothetical protein
MPVRLISGSSMPPAAAPTRPPPCPKRHQSVGAARSSFGTIRLIEAESTHWKRLADARLNAAAYNARCPIARYLHHQRKNVASRATSLTIIISLRLCRSTSAPPADDPKRRDEEHMLQRRAVTLWAFRTDRQRKQVMLVASTDTSWPIHTMMKAGHRPGGQGRR